MGINIKSILLLSFVSLCINTAAEIRNKLNINRGWKFELNEVVGAQHTSFDDNGWMNVNLPHSFSIPYFMWHKVYQGTGWYRKEFDLPTNTKGKTVTLEFEASFIDTEVYVNGVKVGNHVGGYTGFVFDITRYLQKSKNIIAVRVNNEWKPDVAPRAGDHQFSGGIYRDVYLNITDPLHVDWCGTFVTTPHVSATSAICNVKTEIRNNNNKDKNCKVKTEIINDSGNVIVQTESSAIVKMNECRTYEHSLPEILNPKLWSPETPSLYKARTTVYDGKKVTDVYETTFGIRSIEWSADKGFFLNGSHYYLRGANVHQDQAGWGDAVTNAALRRDVQMMKDAGFNCIRGSHYPHDPAFVQACDEIGMIYFQENVLWGMGGSTGDNGWGTPSSSCYPVNKEHHDHFDNSVLTQLEEMVRIHRNSASIVAWSMCNEPFFTDWETNQPMK
ncbi:MAG: glycoside hydrolase family 2 TIM barrel-domain containing protein, partial [Bacteroidales bacterium]